MDLGATPSGALNVLLVEDEIMIAMLMEDVLADMGHVVVGVACGVEAALEMAETVEADLAILDVNLDGRPSFPVADVLRRRGVRCCSPPATAPRASTATIATPCSSTSRSIRVNWSAPSA